MRIGLFIPCYIDQFYPQIGTATIEVLERFPDLEIDFPEAQTCCGQPMANTGCLDETRPMAERFVDIFCNYDHVVSPSGSCVAMVRHHYENFFHNDERYELLKSRTWELCEFLSDVMRIESIEARFPHRVGLHSSCHGLRELRLDPCSERMGYQESKVKKILHMVPELQLVELERADECCGFGGMFAIAERGVSVMMGADRVADHVRSGAQIMTATDASCLMHMEGIIRRQREPLITMHVAEILAGRKPCLPH